MVEGVAETPAVVLIAVNKAPQSIILAGEKLGTFEYSAADHLLWIRFSHESRPRELALKF